MSSTPTSTPQKKNADRTSFAPINMTPVREKLASSFTSGGECCICLDEFPTAEDGTVLAKISTTRCGHRFHTECLLQSKLKGKYSCPMCRSVLTPPPTSVFNTLQAEPTETEYPSDTAENRLRDAIVASSRRGRDAVRLSMLRNNARQALG